MATVSDSSLLTAAQDIVTEFMDKKVTLTDGVIKKASELGLNSDQTQRLIERTNTEAFLRVYPADTDFDVANPEVILGVKTASIVPVVNAPIAEEGLFKAASAKEAYYMNKAASKLPSRYQTKVASVTDEAIFGMDEEFFKTASASEYELAIDPQTRDFCKAICDSTKTASEKAQEELSREMIFDDAIEDLAEHIKQAALQGITSIEESENELLLGHPEAVDFTRSLYDAIVTKLACDGVSHDLLKRAPDLPYGVERPSTVKTASINDINDRYDLVLAILRS